MIDTRWITYTGLTLLGLVTLGLPAWSTSAAFTFPAQSGPGMMAYRCPQHETPGQTEAPRSEANARAAHAAFEAALKTAAQNDAKAMARLMAANRPSAEIAAQLKVLTAEGEATRKALHDQMQAQFGYRYRGSS